MRLILIINGYDLVRHAIATTFRRNGWTCHEATSNAIGMAMLAKHAYHGVLLDVGRGDEEAALDVALRVPKSVSLIVTSKHSMSTATEFTLASLCDVHLHDALDMAALVAGTDSLMKSVGCVPPTSDRIDYVAELMTRMSGCLSDNLKLVKKRSMQAHRAATGSNLGASVAAGMSRRSVQRILGDGDA